MQRTIVAAPQWSVWGAGVCSPYFLDLLSLCVCFHVCFSLLRSRTSIELEWKSLFLALVSCYCYCYPLLYLSIFGIYYMAYRVSIYIFYT